jgi:hypothetical protein
MLIYCHWPKNFILFCATIWLHGVERL